MIIHQKFIPASNTFTRPGIKMKPEYITIHETDNTSRGADDEAHANLQYRGNSRQASWHFTVDDDSIYQSLPTNEVGWHAGDGNGDGNMKSIAIEICVNSDGNFIKAVENAVWLTRKLMNDHNIPVSKVVQHHHWSGKNCPRNLRSGAKGIEWKDFITMVKADIKKEDVKVPEKENLKKHWASKAIQKAIDKKIMTGYSDGTWKPDQPLTRAEFVTVLDNLGLLDN
ncbi:N-acetylmuramoyl-L-alanine amidase [Heyndrickxia oleronia]|uniref:N-acetylmuramoyl-L-alanine amidase n=1 Tax=Heyndrickxia oleronia TaxID=38875 RepID=UPI003751E12F